KHVLDEFHFDFPLCDIGQENEDSVQLPSQSCIDDSSTMLCSIMRSVTGRSMIAELSLSELLVIWANVIAEWHAWEELEDLLNFDCIKEVVNLDTKFGLENFLLKRLPPPPVPPCEDVKQALVIAFSRAAFSGFKEVQQKPNPLWKPLVLVLSSRYLCYPDIVIRFLDKDEEKGFGLWMSALAFIFTRSYEHSVLLELEIKLIVMALAKVVEQQLETVNQDKAELYFIEPFIRLKEERKEEEDDEDENDSDCDGDDEEDEDEDDELNLINEFQYRLVINCHPYPIVRCIDDEKHTFSSPVGRILRKMYIKETDEEFLDREANAAAALENGTIIEEVAEDQEQELELGKLIDSKINFLLEVYLYTSPNLTINGLSGSFLKALGGLPLTRGLEEVDLQRAMRSLLEGYHPVLVQRQTLPQPLVSRFLDTFPEY
ncbi:hypothetical protein RJ641_020948, partial [Dillenia turbinata]